MRVGDEVFVALADPGHRLAEPFRGGRAQPVFAIRPALDAEAAAHVLGLHVQLRIGNAEHGGDRVAHQVRALARDGDLIAIRRLVVRSDDAARLHVVGNYALVDVRQLDDLVRLRERLLGLGLVADIDEEAHIALALRPDLRRAGLGRGTQVDYRRQRLPVDRDRLGRVLGLLDRVGDHESDGVAHVAHRVGRQHRIGRHIEMRLVRRLHQVRAQAHDRLQIRDIGRRQNQPHARHAARLGEIGDLEAGMRVRRAHQHGAQRAGGDLVRHELALAGDQDRVFEPRDGLADAEFRDVHEPLRRRWVLLAQPRRRITPPVRARPGVWIARRDRPACG